MAIKDYNVAIPSSGRKAAKYDADVAEFWDSGAKTAEIEVPKVKGGENAVYCGLRKAISRNPNTDGNVAVVQRRGRVFLERLGV